MEIKAGRNTPHVFLNKEECTLTFKGKSYPEHPNDFYQPILEEIAQCSDYMKSSTITINLILEIMNSLSSKYLYKIIKEVNDASKEININWYYEEDDEDMKEEGKMYKSIFPSVNFNLIMVEDLSKI